MKYALKVLLLSMVVVVLGGCETQKKLMQLGHQQAEMQLYEEAATTYLRALSKKKKNVEAQAAVHNTLSIVFETKSDRVAEAFQNGQLDQLIVEYRKIETLSSQAARLGVVVDVPLRAQRLFEQGRDMVVHETLARANDALLRRDYQGALSLFREVLSLDAKNEVAQQGVITATCEPILEQGVSLYEEGRFRSAYRVLAPLKSYKNSDELAALALEKGTMTFLFVPTDLNLTEAFNEFCSYVKRNSRSPFMRTVTYLEMGAPLREYGCSYNDLVSNSSQVRALADLGKIDAVVRLSPLSYQKRKPMLRQERLKGFNVRTVERKNTDGSLRKEEEITKVYYTVVTTSVSQRVEASFLLSAVNTRNGSVLFEKLFDRSASDQISYIDYSGNIRELRAGDWKGKIDEKYNPNKGDVVYSTGHTQYYRISNLRYGRRTFRNIDQELQSLTHELYGEAHARLESMTTQD